MNPAWAAAGALLGLPAGTILRDPVFRLSVPSGAPDRTACPCCATPVQWWHAFRCRHCGNAIGTPAVLELSAAAVLALLLGSFGGRPEMLAFAYLGVLGIALAAIDIAVQRLPDQLTLPAYPVLVVLLAAAAVTGRDGGDFVRALLGGAAMAGGFLLLALARPGQLGGGDIKLAGLAGLVLGWLGWPALIAGALLGFLLFAVVSLALLALRRITLNSAICFGPFLLGGTLLAALAAGGAGG